ncbi:helix-turn-helix domain-containing protein [Maribellus comscasis]|uniref:Helix-turn-helix domain-containing protein n=1 Tax=Maribellus comscasis TaxID=2681766 RepID=A0A6I6JV55_9BACT|nr:helix-turn-helix domain-containing protein [Maribellus comscasis]QGY44067.1 helix-turn-helix domain-containing protein [Maribellus comscasis]
MVKTISLIGFIQAIFGILIFVSKRPKHLSFTIITFWLFIIAISLGTKLLPFDTVEYLKFGVFPILFSHGPLLYLYVNSLVNENFKLNWKHLLHTLPIFIIGIQRSLGNQVSMNSSPDLSENPNYIYNNIYYALLIISVVTYWILSIQLILKHRKSIPYFFSNYTAKNTLNWLILLIVVFLFLIVIELFISYIEKLMNTKFTELSSIHINLTIFTFMLVFFGIKQTAIYKKQKISLSDSVKTKNTQAALNERQEKDLNKEIIQYLKTKKPYTNPDYSLQMMVEDLNVPRYKISHVINASQKKNFFKFINEFRVKEVKEKLADPLYKHYTLLGIALECGFNSKTSFNRIFKEETGVTPSHYKKSLQL